MTAELRRYVICALVWASPISPALGASARSQEPSIEEHYEVKKGRVLKVDYSKHEISLYGIDKLGITDSTLSGLDNRRTRKNIKKIPVGADILLRYDKLDNIIKEYWILHDLEDQYDLANFVYIQERIRNRIVQSHSIGEVDNLEIHLGSRVNIVFNDQYLRLLPDIHKNRIVITAKVHPAGGQPESLHLPEKTLTGNEMLFASPITYDMGELGLVEGCKVKIGVTFQKKDQYLEEKGLEWKGVSSKDIFLELGQFGILAYGHDTLSFVRDSFGKNWKPAPGASVALGYNFFTWKGTNRLIRGVAAIWNTLDPRIGINVTLLDFDEDKTMEYGLGPEISFLKGGINLGTGWNLSTKRTKNRYVFIGISFTQILKIIRGESTTERK